MRDWRKTRRGSPSDKRRDARIRLKPHCPLFFAGLLLIAAIAAVAQNPTTPGGALRTDRIDLPTPINQPPDAVEQSRMMSRPAKSKTFAAANAERKKKVAEEAAKLLRLAAELKAELDKTAEEPLFPNLIRQIGEIEIMAHNVKEEMKLSVPAN